MRWIGILGLAACTAPGAALDRASSDGRTEPPPATAPADEADAREGADAGAESSVTPPGPDAAADAASDLAAWALYTIAPGAHAATLTKAAAGNPMAGLVSDVSGRDYELAFDPSARYVLTQPTQPDEQLDWNKLPGVSDCGTVDLARDGMMFGWRWRLDTSPEVLEVTAYANNAGTHLTPPAPMLTLDAADLASVTPLRYRLRADGAVYRFRITGTMRGRAIDVEKTLTRRCASTDPSSLLVQWAAGFYFGGTSTAPSTITARIFE